MNEKNSHQDQDFKNLISFNSTIPIRNMIKPYLPPKMLKKGLEFIEYIDSDTIINYLESLSASFKFELINKNDNNYEIKTVDRIKGLYLTINPDPRNFEFIPSNSLVISHHKISVYKNRIYDRILSIAQEKQFNIYNYHLAWDTMVGGIGDSFMNHLGFTSDQVEKKTLTYKDNQIPRLGSIVRKPISIELITSRLVQMKVFPSMIINPRSENKILGYIPGGGFVDSMIIEMAEAGVEVLISSDPNWVVEIVARELDMTLICINHYVSERYGLPSMQEILTRQFPQITIQICEEIETIQLDDLVQDLVNLALKDGVLSTDENHLIYTVSEDIESFKQAYKKAWEDGIITKNEKKVLSNLWKKIYDNSVQIANQDHSISKDERILLGRIIETIINMI